MEKVQSKNISFTLKSQIIFFATFVEFTHITIPRRDPKLFGVNVGCLENFDENNIKDIKNMDGKNHPMDKSGDEKI